MSRIHKVPKKDYPAFGQALVHPHKGRHRNSNNESNRFVEANGHLSKKELVDVLDDSVIERGGKRKWPKNGVPVLSGLSVHDRGTIEGTRETGAQSLDCLLE